MQLDLIALTDCISGVNVATLALVEHLAGYQPFQESCGPIAIVLLCQYWQFIETLIPLHIAHCARVAKIGQLVNAT